MIAKICRCIPAGLLLPLVMAGVVSAQEPFGRYEGTHQQVGHTVHGHGGHHGHHVIGGHHGHHGLHHGPVIGGPNVAFGPHALHAAGHHGWVGGYGWHPHHHHTWSYREPYYVYPPQHVPPAVVQYPYYVVKGPDCFFKAF